MSYSNPVFPSQANATPNMVAPYSNMAPQAVSPMMGKKSNVAPLATKSANAPHCGGRVGGLYTSTGIILVLYILLVIILRAWC